MQEERRRKEDGLNFVSRHWAILLTIASCLIAYVTLNAAVNNHETRICKAETKYEDITIIRTKVEGLEKQNERIEQKLDRLLK